MSTPLRTAHERHPTRDQVRRPVGRVATATGWKLNLRPTYRSEVVKASGHPRGRKSDVHVSRPGIGYAPDMTVTYFRCSHEQIASAPASREVPPAERASPSSDPLASALAVATA